MHKYRLISKKGEGTFSEVLKAQSIRHGKFVAIKCMKNTFDSIDQVNNLREIQALRRLGGHPHVIKLTEVLYDEPTGRLALVFELMDMNMYEAIRGRRHYVPEHKVQSYVYQLLKALDHMHRHGIFHRDVKPENLLLSSDDVIKLADLGSCRGIYSRQPYTEYISTRWYRAPECLLTDGYYNFKMDNFAAGCVWFEIMALFPLFPGVNELDQVQKIHNILGTPSPELLARKFKRNASHMDFNFPEKRGTGIERLLPHVSSEVTDLMKKLLEYDPDDRIIARQALKDPYFRELRELDRQQIQGSADAVAPWNRPSNTTVLSNCSSSDSVDSAAEISSPQERPEESGVAPEIHTEEPTPSFDPSGSSTLPALGAGASGKPKEGSEIHGSTHSVGHEEDETWDEDSTLLPPIGKSRVVKPQAKEKEKTKNKNAANVSLRGGSGTVNANEGHSMNNSKGFERSGQVTLSMGSACGKKLVHSSTLGQSSTSTVTTSERRDIKGTLPRQYVPYSHKQVKR